MKKNYSKMTVKRLEAENEKIMQKSAALREEQKDLVKVLDAKRAQEELDKDMKALQEKHGTNVQVIKPDGIESAESVNGE